ncbi:hypothetical protein [Kineosporia sp. NBRC 101731]|uniref:hypothetical protein n=1 Tax=Kineosporia sp. NBRC 101731 TaxID=3032199 RepID=UPI0024A46B1F|nr:hypothetical protein [Kineosporia sp. NBRC 101731]GLY32081.1 hypothetical protein Kisp02_54460 [Kineosporia sp. NBRC 101731]
MITPGAVVLLAVTGWMLYTGRRVVAGLLLGVFLGSTEAGAALMETVNTVSSSLADAIASIYDSIVK